MNAVVAEDCGICSIKGHDKRYFGKINGEEATGIRQALIFTLVALFFLFII